jgi:UDP-2,4-diacetamido-2,4,6-trideoxy-beta-L-altropyranose hydrolase
MRVASSRALDVEGQVLFLRSDAGPQIGIGHAMRLLALAQAWIDRGGQAVIGMSDTVPPVVDRYRSEGIGVLTMGQDRGSMLDADETVEVALEQGATWIGVDGYWFDSPFQDRVVGSGIPLLCVDDEGLAEHYRARLLVNQNLHADRALYPLRGEDAPTLLGPQFAMLRREFRLGAQAARGETSTVARRILVTLGGADPAGATATVLRALQYLTIEGLSAEVVVGAANSRYDELDVLASALSLRVRLTRSVEDMVPLMRAADIAITSGGTTVWELAAMGVPSIVGAVAEIEVALLRGLGQFDLFEGVGWFRDLGARELAARIQALALDMPRRIAMRRGARSIVDGAGADRVVSEMMRLAVRE